MGLGWSSPFVRWQGALAEVSSLELDAGVTAEALARRRLYRTIVTRLVLGWTVPQRDSFYGAATLAARVGASGVTGPMVAQACATGVATLEAAAATVALDPRSIVLVVTTDRTSNGPGLSYPAPSRPGGAPVVERWVLDSFERDPWAGGSMVTTAEGVAAEAGPRRGRDPLIIEADEGVHDTTAEGLAKLAPAVPGGVVTYGSQTHPADGTAGLVVAGAEQARELSGGEGVARILGTGVARVENGRMPKAPVPAAYAALDAADLTMDDIDVVKTHNPFGVNDIYFAQTTGVDAAIMNSFGCSLVYGHPQAPTGTRGIVELIEVVRRRGGGTGLFTGCAAGDSGTAVVIRVGE